MDAKLDKIAEDIAEIKITMAEVKKDLAYHIRRTDLLESEVRPVKAHVDRLNAALGLVKWVLGFLGLSGLIAALRAFMSV